jgi:hypothetical protein
MHTKLVPIATFFALSTLWALFMVGFSSANKEVFVLGSVLGAMLATVARWWFDAPTS